MHAHFELLTPVAIDEALEILGGADSEDHFTPLGGGTNLIVDMRARAAAPGALVSVGRLAQLKGIVIEGGRVSVGGATTVSEILRHDDCARLGSALIDAARVFAGQMVRNTATLAGNICCGSPAADFVPPLLALDAVVTLESVGGRRDVPLAEFFVGYKDSVRKPNELLTRISWPEPRPNSSSMFYKLARRKGDAITVVGVAVSLTVENGHCRSARIALGAVAPTPRRSRSAEEILEGNILSPDLVEAAARRAAEDSSPIDDIRASAEYREHQVFMLVRRLISQAWANVEGAGVEGAGEHQ